MKALIPSHRENKRYLLLKGNDLKKNVEKAILEFTGILGLSKCGLSFVKNNVICINRKAVDLVRGSFAVFPEKIEVLRVSGTIKGLNIINRLCVLSNSCVKSHPTFIAI
jgi:RNase P/RNase MRP subunit POP5